MQCQAKFLSTLSLRRATHNRWVNLFGFQNFYPRSPCGERLDGPVSFFNTFGFLSTLSLRRATEQSASYNAYLEISIHALLAESDIISIALLILPIRFLSTLSLRRATESQPLFARPTRDFYPRSPCGERHDTSSLMQCQTKFLSTLSLRRATTSIVLSIQPTKFLSTLSLRRATPWG